MKVELQALIDVVGGRQISLLFRFLFFQALNRISGKKKKNFRKECKFCHFYDAQTEMINSHRNFFFFLPSVCIYALFSARDLNLFSRVCEVMYSVII